VPPPEPLEAPPLDVPPPGAPLEVPPPDVPLDVPPLDVPLDVPPLDVPLEAPEEAAPLLDVPPPSSPPLSGDPFDPQAATTADVAATIAEDTSHARTEAAGRIDLIASPAFERTPLVRT
jgi:hypothetical protein